MRKSKLIILVIVLLSLIVIILYPLILNLGYIKNRDFMTPTGNVDIFEIDCDCNGKDDTCTTKPDKPVTDNERPVFVEDDKKPEIDEDKADIKDVFVKDDYAIWGNEKARIFSNPSYEYTSKIAPGSSNSYTFVVKNNNDFDVVVDLEMIEDNPYNVNMQFKLKSRGEYIVGDDDTYDDISKLQLKNVKIKAKESIPYILDWKWIDSENDTEIGEKIDANYKITINIGANQEY